MTNQRQIDSVRNIFFSRSRYVFSALSKSRSFFSNRGKKCLTGSLILLLLSIFPLKADADVSPEYFAQWHISYANYLIDVGKYLEAYEAYNTAYDATDNRQIRLKVLLNKASLLATFLDAFDDAVEIYNQIIRDYPKNAEIAFYRKGLLFFEQEKYKEAVDALKIYLRKYPKGRFRFSAEVLLGKAEKGAVPSQPPSAIPVPPADEMVERPAIRVLLHRKANAVTIKGKDIKINGRVYPKDTANFFIKKDTIFLDDVALLSGSVISANSPLKVIVDNKHKKVRGTVYLHTEDGNNFSVINKIDIESYLNSVVPSESYANWPTETLKAQAVAARTYALYQIIHRKDRSYDLVDNESDHAYKGVERETPRTTKAVKETEGLILVNENRPILAMFTANSGGYTADSESLFKVSKPYLIAHPDPSSLKGKMSYWKKNFTTTDVEMMLQKRGLQVNGLKDIVPVEREPSGRIIKIGIVDQKGSRTYRTWSTLRRALDLPEILFEIENTGDTFIFEGRGWGHGIGYSQWGGAIMGEQSDYKEILKFYYPNTELKKIW